MATPEAFETTNAEQRTPVFGRRLLAAGGILGALAASSCCVIPLVLLSFGVGGAWMGTLTALAPYNVYIVAFTLACLGAGFYFVYRTPKAECAEGTYCAKPTSGGVAKTVLWVATVLIVVAIALPRLLPLVVGIS